MEGNDPLSGMGKEIVDRARGRLALVLTIMPAGQLNG
jgi:hypothetical protein